MQNVKKTVLQGTIVNFGTTLGNKGNGFGFIECDDRTVADAFFNMNMLEEWNFPIPSNTILLNGLRINYTAEQTRNGWRATSMELDGEPNYALRSQWKAAEFELGKETDASAEPSAERPQDIDIHGRVKWYDPAKGFGFIISDDGEKDTLINKSCLLPDQTLAEGQVVRFSRKRNVYRDKDRGWVTTGPITVIDESDVGLSYGILKELPNAEVFKQADVEVARFNSQKFVAYAVEPGQDPDDEANHIYLDKGLLATYPIPNIDDGLEPGDLLRGIVFWKNPETGKLRALPKAYEVKLQKPQAERPAELPGTQKPTLGKDRAPGEN